jgi:hypothetical protein
MIKSRFRSVVNVLLALGCLAGAAGAQDAELLDQRSAAFQRMFADPANIEHMRRYARLSVQLRDHEAAAATLERLLDIEPSNASARLELAAAYFALGSYALAQVHLDTLQSSGGLTPAVEALAARYAEVTERRNAPGVLSGEIMLGALRSGTATRTGTTGTVSLDWRLDLGDAQVTTWVTEAHVAYARPRPAGEDARNTLTLRTGPEFRIAGDAYGPRLQPWIELELDGLSGTASDASRSAAIGLSYRNPISPEVLIFADVEAGRGHHQDESFSTYEVMAGMVYRPTPDTRLRVSGSNRADNSFARGDTIATTLRLDLRHDFAISGAPVTARNWVARGFASVSDVDGDLDAYNDLSAGLSLRSFLRDDLFIEAGQRWLATQSSTGRTSERGMTLELGEEFKPWRFIIN